MINVEPKMQSNVGEYYCEKSTTSESDRASKNTLSYTFSVSQGAGKNPCKTHVQKTMSNPCLAYTTQRVHMTLHPGVNL